MYHRLVQNLVSHPWDINKQKGSIKKHPSGLGVTLQICLIDAQIKKCKELVLAVAVLYFHV